MRLKQIAIVGILSVIAPLGLLQTSEAAPPPPVYKTVDGEIVIHSGLTANQQVTIEYPDLPAKRNVRAGFCGTVTATNSDAQPIGAQIKVDGVTIDVTSLPVQTMPRCENNLLAEARPANFKLQNGNVVVVGKTPGITSVVEYVGAATARTARANNCAFLVIRSSDDRPIGSSIKLNGVSHTVASLPTDNLPMCRTIAGSSVRYNPSNW